MVAAVAALGRIAQGEKEALVAAGQGLQALGAAGGEVERLAGDIRHRAGQFVLRRHQAFPVEQAEHARTRLQGRARSTSGPG